MQKSLLKCSLALAMLLIWNVSLADDAGVSRDIPLPQEGQVKWLEADADQDGKVSYEEYLAAGNERLKMQFKNSDLNGDGYIDKAETATVKERIKALRALRKSGQKAASPAADAQPKESAPVAP